MSVLIGYEHETKKPVRIPVEAFDTHMHIVGATGKGKTVAIKTMLHELMSDPLNKACFVIIDRMGSFSFDLLRWFATCAPKFARDRLVYIEGGNEQHIVGFNPLVYTTPAHGYYKVSRAAELVLRGWESVNLEAMPRLAKWLWNCFWASAQLGLNISDCVHFLSPQSDLHRPLLNSLPEQLRFEWEEVFGPKSRSSEMLDSTRSRLKPYFENPILRQMFGVTDNRMDFLTFMREGKIVVINLAPQSRVPEQSADAQGGLILNEVLSVARSLPMDIRYPTYVILDEFQRYVGPDIELAIPEVRQMGIKLAGLSHQSFSQLIRGSYDLTSAIWQCQSRMIFGNQGEDADLLAHEIASLLYDPKRVKDEIWHRKQLISGHRIIELQSHSNSATFARQWSDSFGVNTTRHENWHDMEKTGEGQSWADQKSHGTGGSDGGSSSHGVHQAMLPEYEKFMELSSRNYYTFEEQRAIWAREVRKLKTGQAIVRLVNDDRIRRVDIIKSEPGSLELDWVTVKKRLPRVAEAMDRLLEENFSRPYFVSPALVERETQERLRRAMAQPIVIVNHDRVESPVEDDNDLLD